ncbi:MAG: hypothetical protein M3125_03755 [Gemmatimonadota bacterium]|nr:hypothetical protein [Gemmatimonadota bacterium]
MPEEEFILRLMSMILPAVVITILGFPLVRVFARRLDRRDAPPANLHGIEERLGRLEAGVDAIALEVERISEGQRFTTRLLAERSGDAGRPPAGTY